MKWGKSRILLLESSYFEVNLQRGIHQYKHIESTLLIPGKPVLMDDLRAKCGIGEPEGIILPGLTGQRKISIVSPPFPWYKAWHYPGGNLCP